MPNDTVTIAQIAKQMKLDPKVARSRLRRAGKDVPKTITAGRWSWSKDKATIVKRC
jgi:hypothetical protein